MGITVTVALPLSEVKEMQHDDNLTRALMKQIELAEIMVESDEVEVCAYADAYVLPEDFVESELLEKVKGQLSKIGVYQLLSFLIDEDVTDVRDLEEIAADVVVNLEEGDLTAIDNVIAVFGFEYYNI